MDSEKIRQKDKLLSDIFYFISSSEHTCAEVEQRAVDLCLLYFPKVSPIFVETFKMVALRMQCLYYEKIEFDIVFLEEFK